jgi:hypothetical protein
VKGPLGERRRQQQQQQQQRGQASVFGRPVLPGNQSNIKPVNYHLQNHSYYI